MLMVSSQKLASISLKLENEFVENGEKLNAIMVSIEKSRLNIVL